LANTVINCRTVSLHGLKTVTVFFIVSICYRYRPSTHRRDLVTSLPGPIITRGAISRTAHLCVMKLLQKMSRDVTAESRDTARDRHILAVAQSNPSIGIRTLCPLYSGCGSRTLGLLCAWNLVAALVSLFLFCAFANNFPLCTFCCNSG